LTLPTLYPSITHNCGIFLQFDALLLRRLISMSGSLARNVAMQQYGEQLGQALTAAAAVNGADSAAARSSVVNCLTKLDTVLEIPDELKMEVRETALQVFMQQVRGGYTHSYSFHRCTLSVLCTMF
jgi:hypothetical protein